MREETIELYSTLVGSHLWGMETPESDKDWAHVYLEPTKNILSGYSIRETVPCAFGDKEDHVYFELGHVVNQILKGNYNFLIYVMANKETLGPRPDVRKALGLFADSIRFKNIYHSVRGLAISNIRKYIVTGNDVSDKRIYKICRPISFAIDYLYDDDIEFKPLERPQSADIKHVPLPDDWDKHYGKWAEKIFLPEKEHRVMEELLVWLCWLDTAYVESPFAECPDKDTEDMYRRWLCNTRKMLGGI